MRFLCASLVVLLHGSQAAAAESAAPPLFQRHFVAGLEEVQIEPARRVRGKAFNWDHEVQIALPPSYGKTKQSYPVLWVTDGAAYFELAVKAVNYDLRRHLPEMIVAAVGAPAEEGESGFGYRRGYEFSPSAVKGFTGFGGELLKRELAAAQEKRNAAGRVPVAGGGAALLLTFLVDELRGALATEYRMAADHTLFGDSGGGVFCAYVLFARPESFSRYICGSPNLRSGNLEVFRMEERYASEHEDLDARVFLGAGEAEMQDPSDVVTAWGVVSSTARMAEILRLRKYPSLKLHTRIFPGEDHASVVPLNLSWGLRFVWEDLAPKASRP